MEAYERSRIFALAGALISDPGNRDIFREISLRSHLPLSKEYREVVDVLVNTANKNQTKMLDDLMAIDNKAAISAAKWAIANYEDKQRSLKKT